MMRHIDPSDMGRFMAAFLPMVGPCIGLLISIYGWVITRLDQIRDFEEMTRLYGRGYRLRERMPLGFVWFLCALAVVMFGLSLLLAFTARHAAH